MRRWFLSPLGKHVYDLLRDPQQWELREERMHHTSGLVLVMLPSIFDIADRDKGDSLRELPWLDRKLLWPVAVRVRDQLKYPHVFKLNKD